MSPLAVNTALETVHYFMFLHSITCPLFWIALPSAVWIFQEIVPAKLIFNCVCFIIAGLSLLLAIKRRRFGRITDWSKEIVVVTGGSHGLGKQVAINLKKRGAIVIVIDIKECGKGFIN
jgi:hypothetical protein